MGVLQFTPKVRILLVNKANGSTDVGVGDDLLEIRQVLDQQCHVFVADILLAQHSNVNVGNVLTNTRGYGVQSQVSYIRFPSNVQDLEISEMGVEMLGQKVNLNE